VLILGGIVLRNGWYHLQKSKAILNTNIVDGFNGIPKYPINPAVIINR
jgi:hypothetical protein